MLITKSIEIDMGHRVPNHKSKCYNMHGHRYKFEVGVDDKVITQAGASDEGMVMDFSDLKEVMMERIDARLDHGFMVWEEDKIAPTLLTSPFFSDFKVISVPFIPTAENIAKWIYDDLKKCLLQRKIKLAFVRIWETPTSTATYTEEASK